MAPPRGKRPGATSSKQRYQVAWWRSLRFRGALLVALLLAGAVHGTGQFLAREFEVEQALGMREELDQVARSMHNGLAGQVAREQFHRVSDRLRFWVTKAPSNTAALVVDNLGAEIARAGPEELCRRTALRRPSPLSDGTVMGSTGGQRVVERRMAIRYQEHEVGELRVRRPLPPATWLASLPTVVAGAALAGYVLAWTFLSRSTRNMPSMIYALGRASKEDFVHRSQLAGCAELRTLAKALNATLADLMNSAVRVQKAYIETAEALARTVEAKDRYTSGHSQRVARYSVEMGEWIGFDRERLETLRIGALLHDIGKVAVPDEVLLKPAALNDSEFEVMRGHPMAGDRILGEIPGLRDMADIARSHHERWDGRGYPLGQSGEAIPLEGRIVAIADAYDALVTKRSYKPAMEIPKALEIIERDAGTHFDPELARVFVEKKRAGVGYKAMKVSKDAEVMTSGRVGLGSPRVDPGR